MALDQKLSESNPDFISVDHHDALQGFWEGRPVYSADALASRQFIQDHPDIQKFLAKKPEQDFLEFRAHGHVLYFEVHKTRWVERQYKSDTITTILKDYPELNEQ